MSGSGDYVVGVIALVAILVSVGFAGRTARRALLPGWEGAPALLATGLCGLGVLVAVSELLGLLGLLDGVLLTAGCLFAGGAAVRVDRTTQDAGEGPRESPPVAGFELGIAIAVAALVAVQWAGPTQLALDRGIYGGDSLWYHMPFAAHIAQTGSVTDLLYTDPLYLNWLYPQNSELLHADALLLLGNDFLSPLLNLSWLGLALFAAWCCGRPYGAGAPAVTAVGALMSANLLFSRQPGNANNDVVAIALLLCSAAILLNARQATARGPLAVAGLAAGLSLGTKLTAMPPVLALTVGVVVLAALGAADGRVRRALRAAGVWIAGVFVGGGLWYVRDLIASGSPFPFVDLGPLAKPEALQGREPFAIAHYLTDTGVWGRWFRPGLEERLGELWPLVLLAAAAGVTVWLWRGGRVERMLAAVALFAAIAYLVTPLGASGPEGTPVGFRLNIRYLAPGLALALVLSAIPPPLGAGRERWWRLGALGLFGLLTALNLVHFDPIQTDRLLGGALLAFLVVGLPLTAVLLLRRGVALVPLVAGAAAVLVAVAVLGRVVQDDYLDHRYSSAAPDYPRDEQPSVELGQGLGPAYDWARGVRNASIGLSGTTGALFQYGLWGPDSSNAVAYVGRHRPRTAFDELETCADWIAAVNAGGYDYLVTTPAYDQDDPESATTPVETAWTASAGAQRITPEGGLEFPDAGLVDVWRVTGPLSDSACTGQSPRQAPDASAPSD